ncbi:ABC transporter substrate-binding protein [Georgenia yuyongxinii]|uniref:Thiamine pyrimidine synthase n=1 Tax=Georgenia yuyongxinii TaxID=2589797 RepID=A0A5B8C4I8_9MICO|nr:ABC transporter substrate-binding protein [Georgenia yuyongxinii]QDC24225.1 ABC transporter substrate-binding protein [Georgenia yuyongxinii]
MRLTKLSAGVAAAAAASLLLAACGDSGDPAAPGDDATSEAGGELTPVSLQLQWFIQGQFAGYLAADALGYYEDAGLDVEIVEGGVDIVPQAVLADGTVDYAIAWVPKALASREQGAGITNVAQIFERSGTLQVAWADSGISASADLAGKKVGNWGFGNEFELFAGMTGAGLDPATDVTLVQQQFDMNALLAREIDAAQAMTYNEYAMLLEAENPDTGELYTADDFTAIDWNDEGVAMLQDAVWANTERLEGDADYQATTVAFLTASLRGWIHCRDNVEECRDITVAAGSQLGNSHQAWMVNEINKLIWPSTNGIGTIDKAMWDQTVEIAMTAQNDQGATVLTREPEGLAYTNDYVEQALEALKADGEDVMGEGYKPIEVELAAGGN